MKVVDLELLAAERGVTVLGEVSAVQPKPLLDRIPVYRSAKQNLNQLKRVSTDLEAMSLVRNKVLPATKTPTRECGFCEFRDICELDEQGKGIADYVSQVYTTWDPYAAHESKDHTEQETSA